MCNITLIGTIHSENGQCNSNELYKILENIKPDVIFDELPSHFSDMYYSDSFDIYCANNILLNRNPPVVPLEVKCNKKYKQNNNVEIIPVDIDIRQELSKYQHEFLFMFSTFYKNEDYIKLDNEKENLISQEGFHFLNSSKFLDLLEKKETTEKIIMESDNQKNRLFDIYKLFQVVQYDNREYAMLDNIYNFSKGNQYNHAVFLIGAEHKKAIMRKITEYDKLAEIRLNWTMYGDK